MVAILLDEFLGTVAQEKSEKKMRERVENSKASIVTGHGGDLQQPLDPLIAGLVTFTTEDDLLDRIALVYEAMDIDESGTMSREQLNAGLRCFDLGEKVQLSAEDWEVIGNEGKWLNSDGQMTPEGFQLMILSQLTNFTNRKLVSCMNELDGDTSDDDGRSSIVVLALKMIINYVHQLQQSMRELRAIVDPSAEPKTNRSRMQVVVNLKNVPLRRSFVKWKSVLDWFKEDAMVLTKVIKAVEEAHLSSEVRFEQFHALLQSSLHLDDAEAVEQGHRLFKYLDLDGSGSINTVELQNAVARIERCMSDRELMLHRSDLMDAKLNRLRNEFNGMQSLIDFRMGALAETVAAKVLAALGTTPAAATGCAAANGQLSSAAASLPESGETGEADEISPSDITSIASDFEPEHAVQDRAWRKVSPVKE